MGRSKHILVPKIRVYLGPCNSRCVFNINIFNGFIFDINRFNSFHTNFCSRRYIINITIDLKITLNSNCAIIVDTHSFYGIVWNIINFMNGKITFLFILRKIRLSIKAYFSLIKTYCGWLYKFRTPLTTIIKTPSANTDIISIPGL